MSAGIPFSISSQPGACTQPECPSVVASDRVRIAPRGLRAPGLSGITALAILLTPIAVIAAPRIGDITHLQGSRVNKLMGLGLVVGLPGTGDGGRYAPTIQHLAALHKTFASPVLSPELLKDAKNVAIVQVEATLPRDGAREGDRVDVVVSSLGPAKSLKGGRLLLTPLVGPNPDDVRGVMALASGPLALEAADTPTVGRVSEGATLEQDWIHNYIALGRELPDQIRAREGILADEPYVTLVIDEPHAEFAVAYTIARTINSESQVEAGESDMQWAVAIDPRTVVVRVPPADRRNPAGFLYRIEGYQLIMPATEARVIIHRASGTIVISGDAEIAPAVISHKGLTITALVPAPQPNPDNPQLVTQQFVAVDPEHKAGAKLQDLVDALNQLRVPGPERITIIQKLHEIGRLNATLIVEN